MQELTRSLLDIVVNICQILAIVVISIGIVKALLIYFRDALVPGKSAKAIRQSRLELGHSFSLGLGFLIGGSILRSAIAPTWDDIGQLAAIIAIRTVLNFFLTLEITKMSTKPKEEEEEISEPDSKKKE
jgi:uncharacterized membrane protein